MKPMPRQHSAQRVPVSSTCLPQPRQRRQQEIEDLAPAAAPGAENEFRSCLQRVHPFITAQGGYACQCMRGDAQRRWDALY